MRVDYSRTYNAKWDHDNQTWWERRSKLEKAIIVSLVILAIVFCGALGFSVYRNSDVPKVCDTSGCLLAASEIARHLDAGVEPCMDFFNFACGLFTKNMRNKGSHKQHTEDLVEHQLDKIITEDIKSEDHFIIVKQKEFYRKCMNVSEIEKESLDIFESTIGEINGWPVVFGYHWKAQQFDWMDMIFELRNRGYYHSMILQVELIQDPLDSNQFIFHIKPPEKNIPNKEFRSRYQDYMVKVVKFFGAQEKLASYEISDVIDFMLKLDKIVTKNKWKDDINGRRNWTEEIYSTRLTVQEFQDHHNEIDWLYFLNNLVHPSTVLSWNDYVIFPKSKYVEGLFYTIHKTPRRVQANYIIWKVLENLMPFMPEELRNLEAEYNCLTNQAPTFSSRHEMCKNVTYLNFYLDPSEITYARTHLPTETRNKVFEMVARIKQEFASSLSKNSLLDDTSKENAIEVANSIKEVVGMQGDYYNDTIFEIYEDLYSSNESDNFFATLLSISKIHTDLTYFLYNKPVNETILFQFASQTEVYYSNIDNAIVVPAGILQGIYYNQDKPTFLNYGGIGTVIGRELARGLFKGVSETNVEDDINNMWTNLTKHSFAEEIQCLNNNFNSFNSSGNNTEIDNPITMKTLDDYIGIEIAYSAYKMWTAENGEEPYLPGIEYSPAQLFWISSVLPFCYNLQEEQAESQFSSYILSIVNNPDFSSDFQCGSSDKSCSVF